MIAAEGATRRVGLPHRSYEERAASGPSAPSKAEWCFVYVVLVATAVIPGLQQKYNLLSQTQIQIFWSTSYVIAALQLWRTREHVLPLVRRCAALWVLILLMFVTALWSIKPDTTIIDGIELLGTTLIGLYIATRFTLPEFLKIVAVMFATVGSLSLFLVFVNPGWGRAFWGTGPWQGIYLDKNLFGAAASLAIISQAALFSSVKGKGRVFVAAGMAFAFLLLIGSNSATAFGDCAVVILATLVALACVSPRFGTFARFSTALAASIACGAVVIFGLTLDSVFSAIGRDANLTGRTDFWPYLLRAIGDQPTLGYGFDAFFQSPTGDGYLSEYVVQAGGWTPYHAHNSYLQVLLDAGYVGLAALTVLVVIVLVRAIAYFARKRNFVSTWPLAIILFLTAGSVTETYYLSFNTLEWILFVAAIVYPLRFTAATPMLKERS